MTIRMRVGAPWALPPGSARLLLVVAVYALISATLGLRGH